MLTFGWYDFPPGLHMPAYQVTFNVQNTGARYGGEVGRSFYSISCSMTYPDVRCRASTFQITQLYVYHPPSAMEPPSILKGFTNIELEPGQIG